MNERCSGRRLEKPRVREGGQQTAMVTKVLNEVRSEAPVSTGLNETQCSEGSTLAT